MRRWEDTLVTPRSFHGIGDDSALRPYGGAVYHYTSSDGLLHIVSSGQLRVSEASSLNDLAEVQLGWEGIEEWLSTRGSSMGAKHIEGLMSQSRRDPKHQVFVLSGTTARDDANQWRLYADQGRGYAIELDGSVSLGVVSLDPAEDKRGRRSYGRITEFAHVVPWFHVLYSQQDLARAMSKLADYAEREIDRIDAIDNDEAQEHYYEVLNEDIMDELAMIAHLYKSSGFRGEQEVRVVARFMWFGKHVGYHASRFGIAGHIHLVRASNSPATTQRVISPPSMFGAGERNFVHPLAITGVRLGPLVHESNVETVEAFLSSYGLRGAAVTQSEVPLR